MDAMTSFSQSPKIKYRKGYQYQLAEDYQYQTAILDYDIEDEFITLKPSGLITIHKGYAWDGASGANDTNTILRGSLIHDAIYQLIREGRIAKEYKSAADQLLHDICVADGMIGFRAWYVLKAVEMFGGPATRGEPYTILEAP